MDISIGLEAHFFFINQTFCNFSKSLSIRISSYNRFSHDEHGQILTFSQKGTSNQEISMRFGVRRPTVRDFLPKYQTTGLIDDQTRSDRPRKTSARNDQRITKSSLSQPLAVSRSIDFVSLLGH